MADLEVDYLVVGAGASGMSFTDALVAASPGTEVLMVDRRHGPGGHWLDAYPFVRLHQPSAYYGVPSRPLGSNHVDESGPNAGLYERATGPAIAAYFSAVLDEVLVPAGVRFVFLRLDPAVEPEMFRGATVSADEVTRLGSIPDVVRLGRVRRVSTDRLVLDHGELPTEPGHVHVDCTAAGVRRTIPRPIFEPGRITLQYVTTGLVPWSAATIGAVEALKDDDETRNLLCPPVVFSGDVADILDFAYSAMQGLTARTVDPDLGPWIETCRLNPASGAAAHTDDPRVTDGFSAIGSNLFPALENLEHLVG